MATKKEIEQEAVDTAKVEVEKLAKKDIKLKPLNLYQKINEVKKVVKTFTKDAKTEGSGSYTYISTRRLRG